MTKLYYFDFKDGVSRRDRFGLPFQLDANAIEHSKSLAKVERTAHPVGHADLTISVINEFGAQIHSEQVYAVAK